MIFRNIVSSVGMIRTPNGRRTDCSMKVGSDISASEDTFCATIRNYVLSHFIATIVNPAGDRHIRRSDAKGI